MKKPAPPRGPPLIVNGWSVYAHPLFMGQLQVLIEEVEAYRARDPANYRSRNCTKRLAAITRLVTSDIPADPAAAQFRQGDTLGGARKHWFRAKFFRFDSASRIIVVAWVNDDRTLRAYGSRNDAYATFRNMLDNGNPPDDFEELLAAAKGSASRFADTMKSSLDE